MSYSSCVVSSRGFGMPAVIFLVVVSLAASAHGVASCDLNGDGKSDIVWRDFRSGQDALWEMNGGTILSAPMLNGVADPNWQVVGCADFNGDGKADLLWRNMNTGQNVIWFMNGGTITSSASLMTIADLNWQVVGVGDFNGDGKADILWRHALTGQNEIWFMNGGTLSSSSVLMTIPDENWKVVGVGDFNGDGKADILWRHNITGENEIWFMNGGTISSYSVLTTLADENWQVVGVGDFNGDGKADILWRHALTGQNAIWFMNGGTLSSVSFLATVSDPNWQVARVGDYNGDGKADILWRHKIYGWNTMWLMNGGAILSSPALPTVAGLNYKIVPKPFVPIVPRFAYVGSVNASSYTVSAATGQLRYNPYETSPSLSPPLAIDPLNRFIYESVGNCCAPGNVRVDSINSSTGVLTVLGSYQAGNGNEGIAADPTGRFVYAANTSDDTVSGWAVTSAGVLNAIPGSPFDMGESVSWITVDSTGSFLFTSGQNGFNYYSINQTTGSLSGGQSEVPCTTCQNSVTTDPFGRYLFTYGSTQQGTSGIFVYAINAGTGGLSLVSGSPFRTGASPSAYTVDPTGRFLYVANSKPGDIWAYTINETTGVLTEISGSPFAAGSSSSALSTDVNGQFLFVANQGANNVSAFTINVNTGALTALPQANINVAGSPQAIVLSAGFWPVIYAPQYLYVTNYNSNNVSGYSINPTNGALTALPGSPFAAGTNPQSVAANAGSGFAYVANWYDGTISEYSIGSNGALSSLGSPFSLGWSPGLLSIYGDWLYVVQESTATSKGDIDQYTIEDGILQSGNSRGVGDEPYPVGVVPSGQYVYVGNYSDGTVSGYTVNNSNGNINCCGVNGSPFAAGAGVYAIAGDPTGSFLYVVCNSDGDVWNYSIGNGTNGTSSGELYQISASRYQLTPNGESIAVDPLGRFAYVGNGTNLYAFSIAPSSSGTAGALISISGSPFSYAADYVAVDVTGNFLFAVNYSANTVTVYAINQTTGAPTKTGYSYSTGSGPNSLTTTWTIH